MEVTIITIIEHQERPNNSFKRTVPPSAGLPLKLSVRAHQTHVREVSSWNRHKHIDESQT